MATKSVENWPLSITPLLIDISLCKNPSKYLHLPYIAGNSGKYFCRWKYGSIFIRFHTVVPKCEQKNLVKPMMKTDFSINWHLKVI